MDRTLLLGLRRRMNLKLGSTRKSMLYKSTWTELRPANWDATTNSLAMCEKSSLTIKWVLLTFVHLFGAYKRDKNMYLSHMISLPGESWNEVTVAPSK